MNDEINYYLMTVSPVIDFDIGKLPARIVLKQRLDQNLWPIYKHTRNRNRLKKNDKLIFYLSAGGTNLKNSKIQQCFFAEATSSSTVQHVNFHQPETWDIHCPDKGIQLKEAKYFIRPVYVKTIFEELFFIKNPQKYGAYLQGGCRNISEDDYNLIVSLGH
jgi:predicted RNA-binding protein